MKKIIRKIIGMIRLEIPEGSKSSRWYAHCYFDFNRYTSVCYIVPINYLVRLIYRLDYLWFRYVIHSKSGWITRKINTAYQTGVYDGNNTKRFIGVIAGNHDEFKSFLKENKTPQDEHPFIYITGPEKLTGYRFLCFIRIGSWRKRPNINEIERYIG